MPPKKRDKDLENPNVEVDEADKMLFLQSFEKPTRIYRFLMTRNVISPTFLYRNLTYMRHRMSRKSRSRPDFSIDSLLENKIAKCEEESLASKRYMTLTFLGFFNKTLESSQDQPVKVETSLLKIYHTKRKDPIKDLVSVGISEVPVNPSESNSPLKVPIISIAQESFTASNGHVMQTYKLVLRAFYNTGNNGCIIPNGEVEEPAQKRRKISNGTAIKAIPDQVKHYECDIVAYDKYKRCLLTNGDYDLVLQEVIPGIRSSPKKNSSWETIDDEAKDCLEPQEVFNRKPYLKIKLQWTTEPLNGYVDRPPPPISIPNDNKENRPGNNSLDKCLGHYNNNSTTSNNNNTSLSNGETAVPSKLSPLSSETTEKFAVIYQFLYNNKSRQSMEPLPRPECPWCPLNCGNLYSLLKHLKLCHSRFLFTYKPTDTGTRIDVTINELHDGSYAGSPHDLTKQPSSLALAQGPMRRTSVTNILVCRPKRTKPNLSEFLEEDENDFENQRPYITGHNRLYYHTVTMLPIHPKEMDIDSEGENDPKWLQTKTTMMIDDFTDVNEGEKELMKLWNLHVMKNGYVGDCQIPLACEKFLEAKGRELVAKNLYRNFILHLSNLFDFNLISPVTFNQMVKKLQDIMQDEGEDGECKKILLKSHENQVQYWESSGGNEITDVINKPVSNASKVNFNQESTNSNARRKSSLPMGSPPSVTTKNLNHSSNKQHPTMMGTMPPNNNKFISISNSIPAIIQHQSNGIVNKTPGIEISNSTQQQKPINGEIPNRRKSTNSLINSLSTGVDSDNNSAASNASSSFLLRKKLLSNVENTSNDYKRKLNLDVSPNSNHLNSVNSNKKTVIANQNGECF